jgi:hypothetical protein
MPDNIPSMEMHLPLGGAVRLGDVVDLAPEVGDPIGEKRAVVVQLLHQYQQVMLLSLSGQRLTVDLDEISIPLSTIPSAVVNVGTVVALAPDASVPDCGHLAVVESVDDAELTVVTTEGCRLSVYPYEVRVPDWDMWGDSASS